MPDTEERKKHLLSVRLTEADIITIDRAAAICGQSSMDFVRRAALQAAEAALMGNSSLQMSYDDFVVFTAAVSGPAKLVPEMVELLKRSAPWETETPERQG